MNNFQTEDLLELAKERNHKDVDSQLAWKTMQGTSFNRYRWLAALGAWMVAKGEKLQARYTATLQTNQLGYSQGKAKKARA
ncbi:MAG: hypothetical protein FJZ86_13105 [Chloroflexi bacterium]|nr:hypothetical protein [Chloroflexota bacterium]